MKNNSELSYVSPEVKSKLINLIWERIQIEQPNLSSKVIPKAYMIGGQPGAGKSTSTEALIKEFNNNILKIDMDNYREFHPNYEQINHVYGKEASLYTNKFAAEVRDAIMKRALDNKYNVIIDGTMKNHALVEKQINQLEKAGYNIETRIYTCSKETSWSDVNERYNEMLKAGQIPRYVPKEFHDSVLTELPKTIDKLYQSGKIKIVEVYNRQEKLYDSRIDKGLPSVSIQNEINKNENKLSQDHSVKSQDDIFSKAFQTAHQKIENTRSISNEKSINKGIEI